MLLSCLWFKHFCLFLFHIYVEITYSPEISVYGITLASVSLFSLRIIVSAQGRNPDSLHGPGLYN